MLRVTEKFETLDVRGPEVSPQETYGIYMLANVYRAMDAGTLEEAAATKRAYVLQAIGKVIEAENEATIMERITALEEQLAGGVAGRLAAPAHHGAH